MSECRLSIVINMEKKSSLLRADRHADKVTAQLASVMSEGGANQPIFVSNTYLGPTVANKKFVPGQDKVYYALAVYGDEEKKAVKDVLEKGWLGLGQRSAEFSAGVAKIVGKKYGVFLNSGSAGTLVALKILDLPAGSEVITTACNFATTIAAILHNNLVPVVADAVIGNYNLDLKHLDKMVSKKTKAIILPHVLGSVNDMAKLKSFAKKHKLYLVEDSCDTLGGMYAGKPTGSFSDITVCSFYASHHITAGGSGGMVCVNDPKLLAKAIAYRDWGRYGDDEEDVDKRFGVHIDNIPYDRKFVYSVVGFNLKPTEMQAGFGIEQLKKLPTFNKTRHRNVTRLAKHLEQYKDFFILPESLPKAQTSWLAFPITLKDGVPFKRLDLIKHLEKNRIQVRLLFSGNVFRQPAFRNAPRRVVGKLTNTDKIMSDSFVIGCHQGMTDEMVDYICDTFDTFMKSFVPGGSRLA
jgi:CDP-6-deoxy-D-xylo-4-hexulose-3-dehydrase